MGSFSDGCHAIVLESIDEIYNSLQMGLGGKDFCQLFGICNLKLKVLSGMSPKYIFSNIFLHVEVRHPTSGHSTHVQ
jgi:hypothetical protein